MWPKFNPVGMVRLNSKQKGVAIILCALTIAGMMRTLETDEIWLMLGIYLLGSVAITLAIFALRNSH